MRNLKPVLLVVCFLSIFCQATFSFADSESTAILSNNPVAFYQLNETSNPISGIVAAGDSAGTYNGTYGVSCQNGYHNIAGPRPSAFSGFATNNWAVWFSPSSAGSFVTCPAWNLNTNTVTIMAWIKPVAVVQWAGIVFCRAGTTVAGLGLNATTSGGNPELAYNWANDSANWGWHSGLYAPLNQWSLVTLVVTPASATMYLGTASGAALATHTYAHPVQNFDGVTLIGQDSLSNPGRTFNGSMDEVAVFQHALSQAQVQAIYSTATPPAATIDTTRTYQTMEGLGGATCFYAGWLTAHPYKQEIYSNAFAGLNLSMLRLGNWFRYQGSANFDSAATEIVASANASLGRPVPVYMSSWSPPAALKSNGQVGNGGTLIYTNGAFIYDQFAQYWYDSLLAYRSNGVSPAWISIQNEPDWVAGYDSCIFHPTEDTVNGTNYASYSKALDAVYQRLTNVPAPPKLLAPECVHIAYNDLRNYAATMNSNNFYGVAYHLYGDSTDGTADGFINNLRSSTNIFPNKPHFMTEYGVSNMIECATLIHNSLTEGQVSGYNHWNLVWPGTDGGLIQIENPWSQSSWTNAPPGTQTQSHGWWLSPSYWAMKHFSYYITPGSRRIAASCNDASVRVSAYLTAYNLRLVSVFINRGSNAPSTVDLNFASFPFVTSSVFQTAGTNQFQALGPAGAQLTMPPQSLTTVVLERFVSVGPASNPSPAQNATGVGYGVTLTWLPGSNAISHAVYLGTSSNAVAQAMPASPEFKGNLTTNSLAAALTGGTTCFWRVDEIAGANTNTGPVWSFATAPLPALAHRYSFGETGGTNAADSVGGLAWTGTLPAGGTLAGGQLTLVAASQQHARLPAGIVSTLSNFTIETWVRLNSTTNWSRIFDFGNNSTTNMFLTPQNGSSTRLRFGITTSGGGGEQQINGTSALTAGVWYHVAVTLNGNIGILYLNGIAVGTNGAMTLKPLSLGSTANNYLGKSQYPDPYLNGLIDEFRIYSVALSASEIAATYTLGPSQVLSTNSPSLSMTTAPSSLILTWPLASAGFTVQSRTNLLLGNWVNLTSPVPQIVSDQWRVALPISTNTPSTFYQLSK